MLSLIPLFLRKSELINNIFDAIQTKLDGINVDIDELKEQYNVYTVTYMLNVYEKEYGITTDITKDITERREFLASKIRGFGTLTNDKIKNIVDAFTGGNCDVLFSASTITIQYNDFIGTPPNQVDVETSLLEVIPCHLALEFARKYLLVREVAEFTINGIQTHKMIEFAPFTEPIALGFIRDAWTTKENMTTARGYLTSSVVDDVIYCIGGFTTWYTNKNEAYDTSTNTWTTKANMTTARGYLTSSAVGTVIYCIGGSNGTNKNEAYDTATNTWTTKANMTTARYALTSSAVGSVIYCVGGFSTIRLATNEAYDTATNTWTTKATMITARSELTSSAVGSVVYCIGGANPAVLNKNEAYDTATNTWTTKTNMPTIRTRLTSSAIGSAIYCIGGYSTTYSKQNEVYDTNTNTWITRADMTTARTYLTSDIVGSVIYCIGGYTGSSYLATNEAYRT